MSPQTASRLAWSLGAAAIALMLTGRVLYLAAGAFDLVARELLLPAIAVAFAIVGALVASRRPGNAIGWILLGVGASVGLASLAQGFVEQRLQSGPDIGTFAGIAAVYYEFKWLLFVVVPATFLLLRFPDGQLLSRRWRWIGRFAGAGIVGVLVFGSASTTRLFEFPTLENPVAVDGALVGALTGVSVLLIYVGIFGSVASVVVRYRRAGRVQRQQIKWLATAGAILAVVAPLDAVLDDPLGRAAFAATTISVLMLPVAVGIAILRHRLYDIDVVINRTLVYGSLTATLAGSYLVGVLLLQLVLNGVTADNGLVIAGSTLAVAALFQPVRRRIQSGVDRRFFRSKYDAARTLERFGARLRDEVDLDALADDLRAVVAETMQPAHVTLWLRETR